MLPEQFTIGVAATCRTGSERLVRWVRRNNRRSLALRIRAIAGPGIICWMIDHTRSDRVQFNIPVTTENIGFLVRQAGFVTSFPKVAAALVGPINVLNMSLSQVFHQFPWPIGAVRSDQKMHVIGHQYVFMNRALILLRKSPFLYPAMLFPLNY